MIDSYREAGCCESAARVRRPVIRSKHRTSYDNTCCTSVHLCSKSSEDVADGNPGRFEATTETELDRACSQDPKQCRLIEKEAYLLSPDSMPFQVSSFTLSVEQTREPSQAKRLSGAASPMAQAFLLC